MGAQRATELIDSKGDTWNCLCVSTPKVTCGWVDAAMVDSIAALPVTGLLGEVKGRAAGRGQYC